MYNNDVIDLLMDIAYVTIPTLYMLVLKYIYTLYVSIKIHVYVIFTYKDHKLKFLSDVFDPQSTNTPLNIIYSRHE